MRSMTIHRLFAALIVPGLFLTLYMESLAAPPSIRTANARTRQIDPSNPTPTPLQGLPPSPSLSPIPSPGGVFSPTPAVPPVPSPDPGMGGGSSGGGAMYSQPLGTLKEYAPPPKPYLGDPDGQGSFHSPTDAPTGQPLPALNPNAPMAATDRFGVAPPPGTLGHTYHRRSKVLDEKKHPRVGIVEVYLSENYDVSALGMKSKWTGKLWELESDPLLPGIPHIFEVKAEWGPEGARKKEVRTIRLIMGRVVDLEF